MTSDRRPSLRPFPRRDPAGIERLRERVRALEGWGGGRDGGTLSLGAAAIDSRLPWGGLPRGALHEVFAGGPGAIGAATGFCAALAARLVKASGGGMVLWCEAGRALDAGGLYAPGLARFGLAPERIVAVRAGSDADALWAMEQGLGAGRVAAVVGEITGMPLKASRRLQLTAEAHGVTALILRPHDPAPAPSAAVTRWRIAALAAGQPQDGRQAPARWRAEMFRCRGGGVHAWEMEWHDETSGFTVVAPVRHRPAMPRASRMAG